MATKKKDSRVDQWVTLEFVLNQLEHSVDALLRNKKAVYDTRTRIVLEDMKHNISEAQKKCVNADEFDALVHHKQNTEGLYAFQQDPSQMTTAELNTFVFRVKYRQPRKRGSYSRAATRV